MLLTCPASLGLDWLLPCDSLGEGGEGRDLLMHFSEPGQQSGLAHLLVAHQHQLHALIRLGTETSKEAGYYQ